MYETKVGNEIGSCSFVATLNYFPSVPVFSVLIASEKWNFWKIRTAILSTFCCLFLQFSSLNSLVYGQGILTK